MGIRLLVGICKEYVVLVFWGSEKANPSNGCVFFHPVWFQDAETYHVSIFYVSSFNVKLHLHSTFFD